MLYNKRALSIDQQLEQLEDRGLVIDNPELAKHYLEHVSYYRLAGYWWSMQENKETHIFKANSQFSNVINLYNFDRELRILLFDAIEKIEISLRTKMIYHLSHEIDPHWFENNQLFIDTQAHIKTLATMQEEIERSRDIFIKQHKKQYKEDKRFPPSWKTLELTSLGALSRLYGNLKNTINSKDQIAVELGAVNHTYLPSWLQSITQIRNYCAHHSRLWNRNLPGAPKLLSSPPFAWVVDVPNNTQKLYLHLCIIKYLLNIIAPKTTFTQKFESLLLKYPNIDHDALGLKENWTDEELWT